MSLENVYYRAARPLILSAPGRILWYVSQQKDYPESMQIRACSYLREVLIGSPKNIFNRFRRLGVFAWRDVKQIVNDDLDRPIMGFCFSHTELLSKPISWAHLQEILEEKEGKRSQIQSPLKISTDCFIELYRVGMNLK